MLKTASYHSTPYLRQRAVEIVTQLGAANRIDWLAKFELDLRQGQSCKERGEAVARLRQLDDARAIPILRKSRDERSGFFGRGFRNWCIRQKIIEAIKHLMTKHPDKPARKASR